MNYLDPYLFYIHEFRKYCINSKLIICIGFSFGDEHIREILIQALIYNKKKKILIISPKAKKVKESWLNIQLESTKNLKLRSNRNILEINKIKEIFKNQIFHILEFLS